MKMTTEEAFVKVLQMHGIKHAFGIIGSAIAIGAISILLINRFGIKSINGEEIDPKPKPFNKKEQ